MAADDVNATPQVAESERLSDADVQILTEARTTSWKIQQYEHAVDITVQRFLSRQTLIDFFGVLVAVLFLFINLVVSGTNPKLESAISHIGSGLSVVIILSAIWGAMAQWKGRIVKLQTLSTACRDLITTYEKLIVSRPVDHVKLRKWMIDAVSFEEAKKDPLATVPQAAMRQGFKHIGNLYPGRGVVCSICNSEWTPASNKKAKWSWIPFKGCEQCGV